MSSQYRGVYALLRCKDMFVVSLNMPENKRRFRPGSGHGLMTTQVVCVVAVIKKPALRCLMQA